MKVDKYGSFADRCDVRMVLVLDLGKYFFAVLAKIISSEPPGEVGVSACDVSAVWERELEWYNNARSDLPSKIIGKYFSPMVLAGFLLEVVHMNLCSGQCCF